jgi:hypothetical protein
VGQRKGQHIIGTGGRGVRGRKGGGGGTEVDPLHVVPAELSRDLVVLPPPGALLDPRQPTPFAGLSSIATPYASSPAPPLPRSPRSCPSCAPRSLGSSI